MWWLYIFYVLAWAGYIFLAHLARTDDTYNNVIWRKTPKPARLAELTVGICSWIVLGVYISLGSGYDVATLVLFFFAQYGYIGTMLWEGKQIKKDKKVGPGATLSLYTFLTLSVLLLLIHLFLGGTYGWMILVVSALFLCKVIVV